MGVLTCPRTGDMVLDLERYVEHEQQLWVCWSFPHFVRYLREIIVKLTPRPHRCTEAVLDAAANVLASGEPALLTKLLTTPPDKDGPRRGSPSRGRVARQAANAIVEVIGCWMGFDPGPGLTAGVKFQPSQNGSAMENAYDRAKSIAHTIEVAALAAGMTMEDLHQCAVAIYGDVGDDRRDAALAAMSAGHFQLSHEIAVDKT